MRRNQVPASTVSIPNKGGPNVQHTFSMVTAQERICWQFGAGLWSSAHTPGCLVALRTFRWFSTITPRRCYLTNQLWSGYNNDSGTCWPAQWTLATLQRGSDGTMQQSCWCVQILKLEPQQDAWAAQGYTIIPLLVLLPHISIWFWPVQVSAKVWLSVNVATFSFS